MNDLAVATLPQTLSAGLYTLRVSCDANGFAWVISQNGNAVATLPGNTFFADVIPYGYDNNQFSRLAELWVEYRVNWIEIELIPAAGSGGFGAGAMVSLVDESGTLQGNEALGDLIPRLSSQRTTDIHTPYQRVKRRFNLAKWIG